MFNRRSLFKAIAGALAGFGAAKALPKAEAAVTPRAVPAEQTTVTLTVSPGCTTYTWVYTGCPANITLQTPWIEYPGPYPNFHWHGQPPYVSVNNFDPPWGALNGQTQTIQTTT